MTVAVSTSFKLEDGLFAVQISNSSLFFMHLFFMSVDIQPNIDSNHLETLDSLRNISKQVSFFFTDTKMLKLQKMSYSYMSTDFNCFVLFNNVDQNNLNVTLLPRCMLYYCIATILLNNATGKIRSS